MTVVVTHKPLELVLTRVFDAPRRLVFEAWSRPEHMARWWGRRPKAGRAPNQMTTSTAMLHDSNRFTPLRAAARRALQQQRALALVVRQPRGPLSGSGIYGDATLATVEKGRTLVEGMTRLMVAQIEELRRAQPPEPAVIYGRAPAPKPPAAPPTGK